MTDTNEDGRESEQGADDRLDRLERENEQLRERLAALESLVTGEVDGERGGGEADADGVKRPVTSGGQPTKVIGRLSDTDGIGVLGEATGSGVTSGVKGITQSTDYGAAGVRGEAAATAGETYGVHGKTNSEATNAFGVFADARNVDADALRAEAVGGLGDAVHGITDTDGYWGVWGQNQATSGPSAYGVYAETDSSEAPALYATGNGGGAIAANGHLQIGDDTIQRTAGPIAKGAINSDGTIANAVNVDSVMRIGGNDLGYRIALTDVSYSRDEYVTVVTPYREYVEILGSNTYDLAVYIEDSNGNRTSGGFQFVTYDLPSG